MPDRDEQPNLIRADSSSSRAMVPAMLLGKRSHATINGVTINIWQRQGKYIARGYYKGERFGETLGATVSEAEARLRQMMVDIENETYVRASQRRNQIIQTGSVPKLSIRELVARFLADKRKLKGESTTNDYRARLTPLLEFVETGDRQRRWRYAANISGDRSFAVEFKAWLQQRKIARHGRPGSLPTLISVRQVYNVMCAIVTLLNWARRPEVHLLPASFLTPVTPEIVGHKSRKDPLRDQTFPISLRIEMMKGMDLWQLCALAPSFVLPPRPEDMTGLLVGDIDTEKRRLMMGTRMGGDDFNKGQVSFQIPYPPELDSIFQFWCGTRLAGPLLLRRSIIEGKRRAVVLAGEQDLQERYQRHLASLPPDKIQADADRKDAFRSLLEKLGGTNVDELRTNFNKAYAIVRPGTAARFYDLRGDVSTDLQRAGVDYLVRQYVTGHSLDRNIMATYEGLDLDGNMAKYFKRMAPLLDAIANRARELGV